MAAGLTPFPTSGLVMEQRVLLSRPGRSTLRTQAGPGGKDRDRMPSRDRKCTADKPQKTRLGPAISPPSHESPAVLQLAVHDPARASPASILALQRRYGNAAVAGLLAGEGGTPIAQKNKTGMPDNLKAGIEHLSGMPMDDVRVHYNSSKPAKLEALAYTEGTHIHLGPGQERHLAHEAWHAAQQKQGRASPRTQFKGIAIDDNPHLEKEAEVMGAVASRYSSNEKLGSKARSSLVAGSVPVPQLVTQLNGPKPTITSDTTFAAPDGSPNTRTNVGVGEEVIFTGSAAGNWTAGSGSPNKLDADDKFTWTAPSRKKTATIKLKVGSKKASVKMKVVEPKSITATKLGEKSFPAGTPGAGMTLKFNYHPMNVSFGNVQAKEVSGPATNITGYYIHHKKSIPKSDLYHDSGDTFFPIGEDNKDTATDTASVEEDPTITPFMKGTYDWVIPNKFKVNTEGGDGKRFTKVTQAHKMVDATGKMKVTKAGAQVERSP
jgi:hypothetical protein